MIRLVDFLDDYELASRLVYCLDCFLAETFDDFILLLLVSIALRLHNLVHARFCGGLSCEEKSECLLLRLRQLESYRVN